MELPGFEVRWDAERLPWRATRYAGVSWLPLFGGEAPGEDATVVIRMEPGSAYPRHRHEGVEEVLVLQGAYRDELGLHPAGAYVRYPAGSEHAPVAEGDPQRPTGASNPACLLFASARGGVHNVAPGDS